MIRRRLQEKNFGNYFFAVFFELRFFASDQQPRKLPFLTRRQILTTALFLARPDAEQSSAMTPRSILLIVLSVVTTAAFADNWRPITTTGAPTARTAHSAIFTRIDGTDQMIVWGGQDSDFIPFANTGGLWKR